ncbi:MAG TPA: hypothetical protein VFO31_03840 [Vicinamibacterales bacterium]|nr:hypothetical protein [Vicinamibacterales bacterium]
MTRGPSNRRPGVALPAAVFVLAIVVLFVAGSAFAATQEARASVGSLAERLALEAAEYGAAAVLRDWDRSWNVATPVGQTLGPFTHTLVAASAEVRMTRTTPTVWWMVSVGMAGGSLVRRTARRTVNAVLRLELPPGASDAALGVADSAHVTGSGLVIGADSAESLPACGVAATLVAGVAAPDTTRICDGTCGVAGAGISGAPPLIADSTVTSRVISVTAAITPDIVLPAGAIVTPAPVVNGGVCDTTAMNNWGDPNAGACRHHLPVIKSLGDLTVRGGTGQGIIIAGGDVAFENGARFAGLVIAADDFRTGAGGGEVLGAVLANDIRRGTGDYTLVANGGLVRRSSCRVRQARLAAASPLRVRQRWWAEFD